MRATMTSWTPAHLTLSPVAKNALGYGGRCTVMQALVARVFALTGDIANACLLQDEGPDHLSNHQPTWVNTKHLAGSLSMTGRGPAGRHPFSELGALAHSSRSVRARTDVFERRLCIESALLRSSPCSQRYPT